MSTPIAFLICIMILYASNSRCLSVRWKCALFAKLSASNENQSLLSAFEVHCFSIWSLALEAMIVVKNGFRGKLGFEKEWKHIFTTKGSELVRKLCGKLWQYVRAKTWDQWNFGCGDIVAILWPLILGPKRARRNLHNTKLIWLDLTVQRQEENQWMAADGVHRMKHVMLHHVTLCYTIGLSYHLQASVCRTRGAAIYHNHTIIIYNRRKFGS